MRLLKSNTNRVILAALGVFASSTTTLARIEYTVRPIALTGQKAPGQVEAFTDFGYPVLNPHGQVAFAANRLSPSGDYAGIYYADSEYSIVHCVADVSTRLPQDPCFPFTGFSWPYINNKGTLAFYASGLNYGGGVYSGGTSPLRCIAWGHLYRGTPVPGHPGSYFTYVELCSINNADAVVFKGGGGPAAVGLYADTGIGLTKIVDSNTPVPGQPSAKFDWYSSTFQMVSINDSGDICFLGSYSGGEGWQGVYFYDWPFGILQRIGDGTTIPPGQTAPFERFFSPSLNTAGQVAFSGWGAGYGGCYLWTGSQLQVRATGFLDGGPSMNDSGTVAFALHLGAYNRQICQVDSGSSQIVVSVGDSVPDLEDTQFTGTFLRSLADPVINNDGAVAFHAYWDSPLVCGQGIYTDAGGWLVKIVDTKDTLVDDLSAVDIGIVATPGLIGSGRTAFNDCGQVAFWAKLSDNQEGVFLAEPKSIPYTGDFNADGKVNFRDFATLGSYWRDIYCSAQNNWCRETDFEPDGDADPKDLAEFAKHWLEGQ